MPEYYEFNNAAYTQRVAAQMVFHKTIIMLQLGATQEEIQKMCNIINKILLSQDLEEDDKKTITDMFEKYRREV